MLLLQKARRHKSQGLAPTDCKHMVSGTISLPARGTFTFPSRYLSAIGHQGVFRLNGWSRQIHTEFQEFRATWEHMQRSHTLTRTGLSPSTAPPSRRLQLHAWFLTTHHSGRSSHTRPTTPHPQPLPGIT